MYAKRIQIANYGPIDHLDVTFPFEGDTPKPVFLVGENGSGKSILLSHIVNGLILAKSSIYPETPEVETGKVYKLRSNQYIQKGAQYYFAKVEFESGLFVSELRSTEEKREYDSIPSGIEATDAIGLWNEMNPQDYDNADFTSMTKAENDVQRIFSTNCVLYFPPNRFEDPAWLNEENLKARARYMDLKHMQGRTERKIICYSPLHDNQNWLFEVLYDRVAFEVQTDRHDLLTEHGRVRIPHPVFLGYSGAATSIYNIALQIIRTITRRKDARFGIGRRGNRVVSVESALTGRIVPNIFQLSSGETSLLNLFLSILRDYDLCGAPFSSAKEIRGIVVVDEIDLHLHAVHQHEVLPGLIQMFPNIQFIVTTHSPLFVLGMQKAFGEDGFSIYQLPDGQQILPEEFCEFGQAYKAFADSRKFARDIKKALEEERMPILLPEGETDVRYLRKAALLLGENEALDSFQLKPAGGAGKLTNIFKHFHSPLPELLQHPVVLLFDCDKNKPAKDKGRLYQRSICRQPANPLEAGIENLFTRASLERARSADVTLINIEREHEALVAGCTETVPEKWTVNEKQKSRLCDWLCEHGDAQDFQAFKGVLQMLAEVLKVDASLAQNKAVASVSE